MSNKQIVAAAKKLHELTKKVGVTVVDNFDRKLKICPFKHKIGTVEIIKDEEGLYAARCTQCGARGSQKETPDAAAGVWNRGRTMGTRKTKMVD